MLDFLQKRKLRSRLYHTYTLIFLGVIVLFAFHSTWSVYTKKRESEELRMVAQEKLDELNTHEAQVDTNIARIQTPEGVEAEIRSKYNVAKVNESMVVLVDDATSTPPVPPKKTTIWSRIKGFFTN